MGVGQILNGRLTAPRQTAVEQLLPKPEIPFDTVALPPDEPEQANVMATHGFGLALHPFLVGDWRLDLVSPRIEENAIVLPAQPDLITRVLTAAADAVNMILSERLATHANAVIGHSFPHQSWSAPHCRRPYQQRAFTSGPSPIASARFKACFTFGRQGLPASWQ
jgi:hypothetical protein